LRLTTKSLKEEISYEENKLETEEVKEDVEKWKSFVASMINRESFREVKIINF
jgi:hypothetical protein